MDIREKLREGNRRYRQTADAARRIDTAENGQHPYAIVVCCSDSRVIPEQIFQADVGDLFVIRVAGNVLDRHQLGSVEYAADHLHCPYVLMLGHTGCGAVHAALTGGARGISRPSPTRSWRPSARSGMSKRPAPSMCVGGSAG